MNFEFIMKYTSGKSASILLLAVIVLLFYFNVEAGSILAALTIVTIFLIERKCAKMFFNWGFMLFVIIAIGVPLILDFSLAELQKNIFIILRGVLVFIWVYMCTKNFTSTGTYKKLKACLPVELIDMIQLSLDMLPTMQKIAYDELKRIRIRDVSLLKFVDGFLYVLIKAGEKLSTSDASGERSDIIIITGKVHEGKTTLAREIANKFVDGGKKIGGVLCEAENRDGYRFAYHVEDLRTGQKTKLISKEKTENYYDVFWSYYFMKDGMDFVSRCLSPEYLKDVDAVFVDEIGAMELDGRGYCDKIPVLLDSGIPAIYLVIREQFVDSVCKKFNITYSKIIKVGDL